MENGQIHTDICCCKKIYCVQCRKLIFKKDSIAKYGTSFCSMKCSNKYGSTYIKCKNCLKKILIVNSLPSYDRRVYYCSLECLEKIEPERKKRGSRRYLCSINYNF